ncbi:hypothetical protein PTR34_23855 [Serratia nevei]|uniref:hypothetical protein n=1 Tax=Serratia TaxID=613 RepID=UPI00217C446C|nr:hypothetical protein [Serratia marcescens]CAI1560787.1 Uncharacterised protein [Serratia marcescens]
MISINNHLSTKHKDVTIFLEKIVEDMWKDLNPNNKLGKPTKRALTEKVEALWRMVSSNKYREEFGSEITKRHLNFTDYLRETGNLENIIKSQPEGLKKIIKEAQKKLIDSDLFLYKGSKVESQPFGLLLLKLFNYESYRASDHCYKRYQELGFTEATCPYCNENTVRIIEVNKPGKKEKVMMLYDIDHFYPKHMFPYLALSFYNHIPSCKTCNQTFKGSIPFDIDSHIHPYHQCFDSIYQFKVNHSVLSNNTVSSVNLVNNTSFPDKLVNILQLESRYQNSINIARIPKLIDILSKRTHLLRNNAIPTIEREMLMEELSYFGLIYKKEDILSNLHSKFHRDIVKFFDVHNTLNLM